MTKWGITPRILSLALTPTILVALLMSVFFFNSYSKKVDESLIQRGKTIATHLAISSEYDIVSQNFPNLQGISKSARDNDKDVLAIIYYDKNHRIVSSTGDPEQIKVMIPRDMASMTQVQDNNIFRLSKIETVNNGILFYAPIISSISIGGSQWDNDIQNNQTEDTLLGYSVVFLTTEFSIISKYKTLFASILIAIIGLLIGGFLARRMASSVTQPITLMLEGVNKIKDGHLNTRVFAKATAEFKLLEVGINSMAESMENSQQELQSSISQATSDLQETLETLEVNNLELDLSRKQAIEASRVKTEFLANMGHEIRTPMNGVIGFTDILLKTELNNKQKDFLFDIKRSASNLLSIIDDILDYSKIEAGKMSLERYPFDLRECVDDVLSMLGPNANKKGIELVSLIYSDIPQSMLGDPVRIKQILTNLISNAIKFTKSGSVELHAELESDIDRELALKIQIKDTGIGLDSEQQRSLFKAFNQADASTKRVFGGTGLGLVISKSLVEKMGGEIHVVSTKDSGSTFWFSLKCERAESATSHDLSSDFLANKKVLVFDSHPATRLSLIQMLEDLQMSITSFDSMDDLATELDIYYQNGKSVEIIIVGGKAFRQKQQQLEYICKQAQNLKCPIISFSTAQDIEALEHLQSLGVTRALRKPVIHRNLYNALLENLRKPFDDGEDIVESYSSSDLANSYVLAVDDNQANLRLVTILLEELGINVDTAENGIQAISLSKDKVYDAIFMDIQMPEMDGLEATRTIRANKTNEKTPIIALTAHSMANEKEMLLESGMNDYMTKPVSERDLVNVLTKWKYQEKTSKTDSDTVLEVDEETSLDWALSLKLSNDNTELAKDMLKMLVESNFETSKEIHIAYQAQEFEDLLHHVHKLHGASCYLGTPRLKRICSQYETKLKRKLYNQLEDLHQELLAELPIINKEAQVYIHNELTQ